MTQVLSKPNGDFVLEVQPLQPPPGSPSRPDLPLWLPSSSTPRKSVKRAPSTATQGSSTSAAQFSQNTRSSITFEAAQSFPSPLPLTSLPPTVSFAHHWSSHQPTRPLANYLVFPPTYPPTVVVSLSLHGGRTLALTALGWLGDPQTPQSLHFCNPHSFNEYQQAISAVGNIIQVLSLAAKGGPVTLSQLEQDYDSDKLFPSFGFGAKSSDGRVMHEFSLNGDPSNPFVAGIDGTPILSCVMSRLTDSVASACRCLGCVSASAVQRHAVGPDQLCPYHPARCPHCQGQPSGLPRRMST